MAFRNSRVQQLPGGMLLPGQRGVLDRFGGGGPKFEFDYNRGVIPTGGVLHATLGVLASGLLLPVAGADQKGHRRPASRHVEGTGCFRSERENRGGTRV